MKVRDLWQEMVRLVMVEKIDLDMPVKIEQDAYYVPLYKIKVDDKHKTLDLEAC